ncbi:MAG: 7-carboxy-7-deazaguanine synthase [Bacteroidota bacterium]
MYSIKEIYYTIQGEGHHTGQPAIFCRFSGCNLWSGLEKDRSTAICQFCDTNFWGTDGIHGGKYDAAGLVDECVRLWSSEHEDQPFIVCTGGEPMLQLDQELLDSFHASGCYVAIESNGTKPILKGIDWVCISPKANAKLVVESGDELKLVYPQDGISIRDYENMDFSHFSLQPLDDAYQQDNIMTCIELCKANPLWKLSLQTHKLVGMP